MPVRTTSGLVSAGRSAGRVGAVNPLAGFTFSRVDMGVDASAKPGTPIRAIGPGRVTSLYDNWFKGQPYLAYQIESGPFKGLAIYVAEQIVPRVRVGQHISAGQEIATFASHGTGIEWGLADPHNPAKTLAQSTTGYTEGQQTKAGLRARQILESLRKGTVMGTSAGAGGWQPCLLTWYDPALGGTNSASGRADPHSKTSSGEPYDPHAMTCAAPAAYAFGTNIMFKYRGKTVNVKVNDRGGAIVGSHFDLSRAAAEALGIISAGAVHAEFSVGGSAQAATSGVNRPDGSQNDDAALQQAFTAFYLDNPDNTGPQFASDPVPGGTINASFEFPVPGLPGVQIPLPGIPGIPFIPNPFELFKEAEGAINSGVDFLKWVAWIFHPTNVLRVVEGIAGLTLVIVGIHVGIEANRNSTYVKRRENKQRKRQKSERKKRRAQRAQGSPPAASKRRVSGDTPKRKPGRAKAAGKSGAKTGAARAAATTAAETAVLV